MNPHRGLLHHFNINVSDLKRSSRFYGPVLDYLGYERTDFEHEGKWAFEDWHRFELDTPHQFSICQGDTSIGYDKSKRLGIGYFRHIAFCASDRDDVDRFYAEILAPLEKEGLCEVEDPPCDCPEYNEGYYATFFFDPDGLKYEFAYTPGFLKWKEERQKS